MAGPTPRRRVLVVEDDASIRELLRLHLDLAFAAWQPDSPMPRGAIAVRETSRLETSQRRWGRPSLTGGRAAYAAIVEAVRLIGGGFADAMTTRVDVLLHEIERLASSTHEVVGGGEPREPIAPQA